MKTYVIYCHGYASSSQTNKVQTLKDSGYDTKAWDLNGNPSEVLVRVGDAIDNFLMDNLHEEVKIVFVGTSLGAWYAVQFAKMYDCHAVLINPAFSPQTTLPSIGVDPVFASQFEDIEFTKKHTVFIAEDDEVIDFTNVDFGPAKVIVTQTGGHRYNGPEFDRVIEEISMI